MKNVEAYEKLHEQREEFGTGAGHLSYLVHLIGQLGCEKILDYGCGKGLLADELSRRLGIDVAKYDPAVPTFSEKPKGEYDLVINTDVLEHIPEIELDTFLSGLVDLSDVAVLIPHMELSSVSLPDGTNVHCTLKNSAEWGDLFRGYWPYVIELEHHSRPHALFLCYKFEFSYEVFLPLHNRLVELEVNIYSLQRKTVRGLVGRALDIVGLKHALRRLVNRL
jgi:hypothetical protein